MRSHRSTRSLQPATRNTKRQSRLRAGCPTSNYQQQIPQAWKEQKNALPNPQMWETMATRSRSTSSRLAFGNSAPVRAMIRHHRCFEAITVTDHKSLASGAVGYASSRISIPTVCRKSVGFVALTSQCHQGTRRGSSKRKESAVRRCRDQSELLRSEDISACTLVTMPIPSF